MRNLNRYMDSVVDKTLALPRDGLSEKEPGELTLREALILKEGSSRKFVRDQLMTILLAAKASTYKSPLPSFPPPSLLNKKKREKKREVWIRADIQTGPRSHPDYVGHL